MNFIPRPNEWQRLLADRRKDKANVVIEAILESQSEHRGGSLPFKALGSDGNVYWIKTLDNPQASRVLATELIVSQCGLLIDAPV